MANIRNELFFMSGLCHAQTLLTTQIMFGECALPVSPFSIANAVHWDARTHIYQRYMQAVSFSYHVIGSLNNSRYVSVLILYCLMSTDYYR